MAEVPFIATRSGMLRWEECPAQFLARSNGRGEDFSLAAEVGTLCHRAVEDLTQASLLTPTADMTQIARSAVMGAAAKCSPAALDEALRIMDRVTAPGSGINLRPREKATVLAEQVLWLDAEFRPTNDRWSAHYGGTLDRITVDRETGALVVDDWKTTVDRVSDEDLREDAQARWYSYLALQWFPAAPEVMFRQQNLRLLRSPRVTFLREDTTWQERIKARIRLFRQQAVTVIEPRYQMGSHCRWCPIRAECPAFSRVLSRVEGEPMDATVRRWRAAKALAEELDGVVRTHVEKHGPVALGEEDWCGHREQNATILAVDLHTALATLRREGMTPSVEASIFVPSDASAPGMVADAIRAISTTKGQRARLEETLLRRAKKTVLTVWTSR